MNLKREYRAFDYWLALAVIAVSIMGIIIIGSATKINLNPDLSSVYSRQKLWFLVGLILMLAAAFVDYHFIAKFYIPIYLLNLALLIAVLFFGIDDGSGVTRDLKIGPFSILPSEFSKIFMIIYLAKLIDKLQEKINNIFILAAILSSIVLPVYLIMKQPSLSASIVTLVISAVIIFVGGLDFRYILAALLVTGPASLIIYLDIKSEEYVIVGKVLEVLESLTKSGVLPTHWLDRINTWIYPGENLWLSYQVKQSIHAIGSGQLTGKGLYEGKLNQYSYLPASENDFIFAVIGEEFGFVGCLVVLAILFFIIIKCMLIAHKSSEPLGKLMASGVSAMLAFQTFVNIGVATGVLPNTGMALPFISAGGSSMLITMIGVGLVLNVGMSRQKSFFEE